MFAASLLSHISALKIFTNFCFYSEVLFFIFEQIWWWIFFVCHLAFVVLKLQTCVPNFHPVRLVMYQLVSAYSPSQNTIELSTTIQNSLLSPPAERANVWHVLVLDPTVDRLLHALDTLSFSIDRPSVTRCTVLLTLSFLLFYWTFGCLFFMWIFIQIGKNIWHIYE